MSFSGEVKEELQKQVAAARLQSWPLFCISAAAYRRQKKLITGRKGFVHLLMVKSW